MPERFRTMTFSRHINTDLEIESSEDLTLVIESFGNDVVVLYQGKTMGNNKASFEIAGLVADPDAIANHFCMLIEGLPQEAKKIWDCCSSRTLDVGYEGGTEPRSFSSEIRPNTIERIAALKTGINITIYSATPTQESER
jgi:hypothetical protein